jgi:hypothetical protein
LQDIEFHKMRMESLFGKNWDAQPAPARTAEDAGEVVSLIFLDAPDCRGPLVLDAQEESDPLEKFKAGIQDEQLVKHAGITSISTVLPSCDEIIGWTDGMESFEKAEHVEVSPEEMTPAKRDLSKASSGPGRIRLEKVKLDGETWLFGYGSKGEEVFARPFEERVDAA